ncbi:PaaX family transcriptional regulator [Actinoalloteichus hymeniacidonis]|uniref:PaaX family transcriptional regulator n=1 Tax=Actinoalloteichus hymeniacidonis TaxID=340345 RepID=UPI000853AC92|nr:PaaX family transcriptional regulator C-terminal domain-containing protein [Actinoalloteichus hymeniacidonis]MBB5910231.1 phenylacetic acid degradation operon negative regulatory protein [Actinoalloteichus hymeniacidonis]
MRARSALFDLFGGHLRARGGLAPIAALVRLLEPLGFTSPAVRTAVSRTVRQGWLEPVRLPGGPGYRLTSKAERRLDEAAARIYRTRPDDWDGRWHIVVLEELPARESRDRLTSSLRLLGYGELGPVTWVAPRPANELTDVLAVESTRAHSFLGTHQGDDGELARRAWNLDALAEDYLAFIQAWEGRITTVNEADDAASFAASLELLHAWRGFLFRDPGLPGTVLPQEWGGDLAAEFFDRHTARLAPAADRFVGSCLANPAGP